MPEPGAEAVLPPPSPTVPAVKGAIPGLGVASQTLTAPSVTTTSKVITPEVKQADKDVAAAVTEKKKALDAEAKNAAEEARIKGAELQIEADRKQREADDARLAMQDAQRRKDEVAIQAKRDQDALQTEAARNHNGFFADKAEGGGNTGSKILWALSLAFGAGAVRYGQDSAGERLLDKAMDDWTQRRQHEVDRLGKVAAASGAAYQNFWANYGAEYQAQKLLKDAAGYAQVASQMRQLVADRGALMTAQAKADALAKSSTYDEKAAQDRQRAVDARIATRESRSGGQVTTLKVPTVPKADKVAADKDRSETLLDLNGNVVGKALTPVEGEKIRASHASVNSLAETATQLKQFVLKHGTVVTGSLAQDRDRLVSRLAGFLTQANQTGTLQQGEYERYSGILAGKWYQEVNREGAAKVMDGIVGDARSNYNNQLRSQAIKLPDANPAAGASGGGVRKLVNGKPAMVYPDGTFEVL
jgi:hypothetical protein